MHTQTTTPKSAQIRTPKQALVDFAPIKLQLVESKDGKVVVRGEFAKCGIATENKRVYPRKVWEKEIHRLNKALAERRVFGELDHPADGRTQLTRVSHIITNLSIENGLVIGEAEIVDSDRGKTLKALLNAGCKVGVSSRGYGSTVENEQGESVVQEDYRLATFDFVAEPADGDAFPDIVAESIDVKARRVLFEGVDVWSDSLDAASEAEMAEKFAARFEAEKRGETEKVRTSMREEMTAHVLAVFADQKAALREQIRGELLSDPSVAAAKKVLGELQDLLLPFLLPEDTQRLLNAKDAEVRQAQKEVVENALKVQALEKDNLRLAELARELGYKLHVETVLSGNPDAAAARKAIGDVAQFASSKELKTRIDEVVSELASHREKLALKEAEKQEVASSAKDALHAAALAAVEAKLADASKRVEDLSVRNNKLTQALDKATEAVELLQIEQKDLVEANQVLEQRLYVENRLTNHPKAARIKELIEAARPSSKGEIDSIIENYSNAPRRDAVDADNVRANIRARLGGGHAPSPRDEETPTVQPMTEAVAAEVGISLGEFQQLTGRRR